MGLVSVCYVTVNGQINVADVVTAHISGVKASTSWFTLQWSLARQLTAKYSNVHEYQIIDYLRAPCMVSTPEAVWLDQNKTLELLEVCGSKGGRVLYVHQPKTPGTRLNWLSVNDVHELQRANRHLSLTTKCIRMLDSVNVPVTVTIAASMRVYTLYLPSASRGTYLKYILQQHGVISQDDDSMDIQFYGMSVIAWKCYQLCRMHSLICVRVPPDQRAPYQGFDQTRRPALGTQSSVVSVVYNACIVGKVDLHQSLYNIRSDVNTLLTSADAVQADDEEELHTKKCCKIA